MNKVIFLDRDGTLNVDNGYVHLPEQWQWKPEAVEALRIFSDHGYRLVVITNQSGIGSGLYTADEAEEMNALMQRDLKEAGITLDAVAYCPHARDAKCSCRKPNTGMLDKIVSEIGAIDFSASWTIGDKVSDVGFGKNAGTKTVLLRSEYWQDAGNLAFKPDFICDSLYDAAKKIVSVTTSQEVGHHWRTNKILALTDASKKMADLRKEGKIVVTVNGSFDLLHAGHLDMLEEAKQQGDVLCIGLNSDQSIQKAKGPDRPYVPAQQRAALLAALTCVDYVSIIDAPYEELPLFLIRAIKPNIHVNGSEYGSPETWVEWPAMQEVGAKGYIVSRRPGLATSDIIKNIKSK